MSTIGLIVDIVLISALAIWGFLGLKKGFLKSLLSLFSWLVCIVISIVLAKYVASWLNLIHNFSGDIGNKIASSLTNSNELYALPITEKDAFLANQPGNGLFKQVIKVILTSITVKEGDSLTIASVVGAQIGWICMLVISGVLIFIVLKIVIALLSRLFDNISRTKVLGKVDKILGFILGILKAGCVVIILNFVLIALSLIPMVNKTILPLIQNETHVERFIYNKSDEFVKKHVIDGQLVQKWITDVYNNR